MKRRNEQGITLIALIITIILMLILAGVVISLTIGKNGLINTAKYAVVKNSEESAREKLELALADLTSHKYTDETYNESEYINNYLENEGMQVVEDVVTVDGWRFKIDRSVPQIGESLGQEEIRLTKIVREYLGKNENGKYIADVTIILESDKTIKNIIFQEQDGTPVEVVPTTEKYKIAKDMTIELDKEYKIVINTDDGKSEEKAIIEKLPDLGILISTPYVGTSSFTTKVQYVTNEEEVETYTYMLDEKEIITNANAEYTIEDYLEPETTHKVQVIAKYKNNLTVESNVVTIKTEPRTYLYNNGKDYTDITGGWGSTLLHDYAGDSPKAVKPTLEEKTDRMRIIQKKYSYIAFGSVTNKKAIDISNYNKICIKYTATLTVYKSNSGIEFNLYNGEKYVTPKVSLCYIKPITKPEIIKKNVSDIKENVYLHIGVKSSDRTGPAQIEVYAIWLEK